ncbi:MAG: ester cyclase [Candidatus Thermoplasmatota archaeon]|nr:ester cyclase [Candidatus Thermoplasmatota archaeon]
MSVEENLRLVREDIETFNARDWDRYYELYAESFVHYIPGSPEPLKGRAAYREGMEGFLAAFPDIRVEIARTFGQGDWVCMEGTSTGTHTGPFKGPGGETIPATNKPVRMQGCGLYKVEGGQITELRDYYDLLGFMTQLGLAP